MHIPFPQSLSIGTDIVYLPRLLKSPAHFQILNFRLLLATERKQLQYRFPDWEDQITKTDRVTRVHEWLGGRLAAKEAAKKAWGASLVGFKDLRIKVPKGEAPYIVCAPFAKDFGSHIDVEQAARLTIAHDGDYAIATVLAAPLHETILAELGRRKAEAEKKVTKAGGDQMDKTLEEPQPSDIDTTNELNAPKVTIRQYF
jgi:holo-[acyl-carrier protein] synthase